MTTLQAFVVIVWTMTTLGAVIDVNVRTAIYPEKRLDYGCAEIVCIVIMSVVGALIWRWIT